MAKKTDEPLKPVEEMTPEEMREQISTLKRREKLKDKKINELENDLIQERHQSNRRMAEMITTGNIVQPRTVVEGGGGMVFIDSRGGHKIIKSKLEGSK